MSATIHSGESASFSIVRRPAHRATSFGEKVVALADLLPAKRGRGVRPDFHDDPEDTPVAGKCGSAMRIAFIERHQTEVIRDRRGPCWAAILLRSSLNHTFWSATIQPAEKANVYEYAASRTLRVHFLAYNPKLPHEHPPHF